MKNKHSIPLADLYEQRVLLFVETASFTNKYRQIYLTEDQYSKMTEYLMSIFPKEQKGDKIVIKTTESNEIYDLPDVPPVHQ